MRSFLLSLAYSVFALFPLAVHGDDAGAKDVYKASVDADGVQRVHIVGGNYFFKPNHIIVKARVPVALSVEKERGIVPHNIVIRAPGAGIVVKEELTTKAKIVTFTPTAPGIYEFYCTYKLPFRPSHRDEGMKGILEVVE